MPWKKSISDEETSESLKKRAIALEKAVSSEQREMEEAFQRKKSLEKALQKKKEFEKVVPSQETIAKNISKVGKEIHSDLIGEELKKKSIKVISIALIILIIFIFLFSESFLQSFYPKPSIQSSFIFDTSIIPDFGGCTFEITDKQAVFTFNLGNYVLKSVTNPECTEYEIQSPGKIVFDNCSFSTILNKPEFQISYENPDSGLVYHKQVKVIKLFETTSLMNILK